MTISVLTDIGLTLWLVKLIQAYVSNKLSEYRICILKIKMSLDLNADISFIVSLLDRVGVLPESTIWTLIYKGNLQAIKALIPYVLKTDYIGPAGETVVQNSVAFKKISILKYLLENNLSTLEPSIGFDALNIAIRDFDMAREGVIYISTLLQANAKIDNTHRHLLYEIKIKNSTWYDYIISIHPELTI